MTETTTVVVPPKYATLQGAPIGIMRACTEYDKEEDGRLLRWLGNFTTTIELLFSLRPVRRARSRAHRQDH